VVAANDGPLSRLVVWSSLVISGVDSDWVLTTGGPADGDCGAIAFVTFNIQCCARMAFSSLATRREKMDHDHDRDRVL
jgi:hypothetical protein